MSKAMTVDDLKKLRASLGLTQCQLASKLGVSCNTVTRWEMGVRKKIPVPIEKLLRVMETTNR